MVNNRIGVLLINLGTPSAPTVTAVRRYLRTFLSDPRVVDLPAVYRYLLVNCVIAPLRALSTAKAYQCIWTASGSPLLVNSQQLQLALGDYLGSTRYCVALGMRYGQPSIACALNQLRVEQCRHIIVLPLFPQYSSAATGSAIETVMCALKGLWDIPQLHIVTQFYRCKEFIDAYSNQLNDYLMKQKVDYVLFSYHGLPQRHIEKSHCGTKHCSGLETGRPCGVQFKEERAMSCYRAQCYVTTEAIAQRVSLARGTYSTAFQSRLGKMPWIKPYTDQVLADLAKQGVRRLLVICPSFVADCLETLEEIGVRARLQWASLGGEDLQLLPCLNATPTWVAGLGAFIRAKAAACCE